MANRRMFANSIINSARFLQMPATTRLLYYDLGMKADDEGFVEAFSVLRMTCASEDDLRLLDAKGYIRIINDDLVAYIFDWEVNNQIRKDRFQESIYHALLPSISRVETSGKPHGNQSATIQQPEVVGCATNGCRSIVEDSIDKNSIEKGNIERPRNERNSIYQETLFNQFWQEYPRKVSKQQAIKAWNKLKPDNELFETIMSALEKQKKTKQWENPQFIPHPSTWLNERRWEDEVPPEGAAGQKKDDDGWGGIVFTQFDDNDTEPPWNGYKSIRK